MQWNPMAPLRRRWEAASGARALLRYLPEVDRRATVRLAALVAANGLLPVAFTLASGALVGSVPAAVRGGSGSPEGRHLLTLVVVTGAIFAIRQAVDPFRERAVFELGWSVDNGLQQRVMTATTAPVGIAHLEDPSSLDRIAVARGLDGWLGPTQALRGMSNLTTRYLTAGFSAVVIMRWHWWLGSGLVVMYILNSGRSRREFAKVAEVMYGEAGTLRRADYVRDLALTPHAAKETRVFGLAGWVGERYRSTWLGAMTEVWLQRRRMIWVFVAMVGVTVVGRSAAYFYVASAGAHGHISLGLTVVLIQALAGVAGFGSISDDPMLIAYGTKPVPAALSLERDTASARLSSGPGAADATGLPRQVIRFEGVAFSYPGQGAEVFRSLDLEIEAGRSLAVVGVNGAGKTTLVKLLARLYDPSVGRITVDGVDLRDLDPAAWQRRLAAIFQDFVRYELSARDNVGFGALALGTDLAALDRAAERAGAAALVSGLTAGWDTVLSRQFEGGTDLSGGEWQKIALARALLAVEAGAGVLVLDEPTANLDVRAEAEVYERFLDITAGLTSIVISHRFSTVRRAERIVVLEHGAVIEDGDHDSLVALDGRYATMYNLQAARFAEAEAAGDPA